MKLQGQVVDVHRGVRESRVETVGMKERRHLPPPSLVLHLILLYYERNHEKTRFRTSHRHRCEGGEGVRERERGRRQRQTYTDEARRYESAPLIITVINIIMVIRGFDGPQLTASSRPFVPTWTTT